MNLIDKYRALSDEIIDEYISSNQEENLSLDFKTIKSASLKSLDDKRNLSRALSGFANSSGGLLIWGVDARKNDKGLDCAVGKVEIEPLSLFLSRLNELTGSAVSPLIDGVLHRKIVTSNDKGFAVTYVPESDSGPHMAKLGEDRYYKRAGDSFYRMEHFDVSDMFGRRKRPKLFLNAKIRGKGKEAQIILGIENKGKGSAHAPFLAFSISPPWKLNRYGLDGNYHEGMKRLEFTGTDLPYRYGEDSSFVIHPGIIHEVASIWLGFPTDIRELPVEDFVIEYALAAEDYQLDRNILKIKSSDIF